MKHRFSLRISLLTLVIITLLPVYLDALGWSGLEEVQSRVQSLRLFLTRDPGPQQGTEVSAADIKARKAEIQFEIEALLASTRETYECWDISVDKYLTSKGTLQVKDNDLDLTLRIKMPQEKGTIVTRNPGDYRLQASRVWDTNFNWVYSNWILKGSTITYYAEVPDPVNTIPAMEIVDTNADPTADITIYRIANDADAQEAISYFESRDYDESLDYFEAAATSGNTIHPEFYYWTALAYIGKGDSETARVWLRLYLDSGDETYQDEAEDYYRILTSQDKVFFYSEVELLPAYLATPYGETNFVISPDGNYLYCSAYSEANKTQTDIWRSERLGNQWGDRVRVADLSSPADEAVGSFSLNGSLAYLSGKYESGKKDFDIYSSQYSSSKWQKPLNISPVNSVSQDIDPWVYEDYLMFFSSNRSGGYGGYDLYYSLFSQGFWQSPVNLGSVINTAGDETAPFLDWDGKTLFFCSTGHAGLGEGDLYKVVILDKSFSSVSYPENLGAPLNSYYNDHRFYHRKGTNQALVISDRGKGGISNIYTASLDYAPRGYYTLSKNNELVWTRDTDDTSPLTGLKPAPVQSLPDFVLNGRVTDENNRPLAVDIYISYLTDATYTRTIRSDSTGVYRAILPRASAYTIGCKTKGYLQFSGQIYPGSNDPEGSYNIVLNALVKDKGLILRNIQFALNSSVLLDSSIPVLNDVILTLSNHPDLKVEIGGHTCDLGTEKANLKLSRERAQAVVDYLILHHIDAKRLQAKGYGESQPLNANKTTEERELNRRVEFKIIN